MYNIFYIYTYKYTKTVKHAHALAPQIPKKPRTHKHPDKLYSPTSASCKQFIYEQNAQAA